MTDSLDLLTRAEALLSEVSRVDWLRLSDDGLVAHLRAAEAVGRFADTTRSLVAAEVADRSRYELGAAGLSMRWSERKPALFVEQVTRVSAAEASRRIRVGSAIRARQSLLGEVLPPELPVLAEAMTTGMVGVEAGNAVLWSLKQASTGSDATPENMDAAELALVETAARVCVDLVFDAGRLWRDALDPEGIEPRYEEIQKQRLVTIGREYKGLKKYTINAAPTMQATLDAALLDSMNPGVGPRFLSEEDRARATTELVEIDGDMVEWIVDPRTVGQKQYDILEGVLNAGLAATREGPLEHRTVGVVSAVISLADLESGKGFGILEGVDEAIPASAIQELACETGFYLLATGSKGEPIYHSTLLRFFTQAQRRAMIARDGDRCIVKGCKKRASASHAHHVVSWKDGGPTDIDNGVLLCPAHHHALHQGAFELRMIDGKPWIRAGIDSWDETAWQPAGNNRLQPGPQLLYQRV